MAVPGKVEQEGVGWREGQRQQHESGAIAKEFARFRRGGSLESCLLPYRYLLQ